MNSISIDGAERNITASTATKCGRVELQIELELTSGRWGERLAGLHLSLQESGRGSRRSATLAFAATVPHPINPVCKTRWIPRRNNFLVVDPAKFCVI
jgi:hypothetical protein